MFLLGWCHWLQNTWWATSLRESDLLFPFVEGSHILALSLSVGMVLILDLRLLRVVFRGEPVSRIMRQVIPWAAPGFLLMLSTGFLLFAAHAEQVYQNRLFRWKFALLLVAGINALIYQLKLCPKMAEWDTAPVVPAAARVAAVLSLTLWACIIALGRTMAYEL